MSDELLKPNEVAALLRVEPRTLADWRYRGFGPKYIRYGGRVVVYRRSEIERFLKDRERISTSQESAK